MHVHTSRSILAARTSPAPQMAHRQRPNLNNTIAHHQTRCTRALKGKTFCAATGKHVYTKPPRHLVRWGFVTRRTHVRRQLHTQTHCGRKAHRKHQELVTVAHTLAACHVQLLQVQHHEPKLTGRSHYPLPRWPSPKVQPDTAAVPRGPAQHT